MTQIAQAIVPEWATDGTQVIERPAPPRRRGFSLGGKNNPERIAGDKAGVWASQIHKLSKFTTFWVPKSVAITRARTFGGRSGAVLFGMAPEPPVIRVKEEKGSPHYLTASQMNSVSRID